MLLTPPINDSFPHHRYEGFKVRSLLTLANIVDESEAHFLDGEADVVKTLIDYCTVALKVGTFVWINILLRPNIPPSSDFDIFCASATR